MFNTLWSDSIQTLWLMVAISNDLLFAVGTNLKPQKYVS